jgi:hypothetical protein
VTSAFVAGADALLACELAGEVDSKGVEMICGSPAVGSAEDRARTDLWEPSRAELMNRALDKPEGLSRLNPHVPPRLRGGKLKMRRSLRFAACEECLLIRVRSLSDDLHHSCHDLHTIPTTERGLHFLPSAR